MFPMIKPYMEQFLVSYDLFNTSSRNLKLYSTNLIDYPTKLIETTETTPHKPHIQQNRK